MPKSRRLPRPKRSERGGYQPFQDGYTPSERRGYVPGHPADGGLPKAPTGGTGQTPATAPPPAGSGAR